MIPAIFKIFSRDMLFPALKCRKREMTWRWLAHIFYGAQILSFFGIMHFNGKN
jgi:hypothetical protein